MKKKAVVIVPVYQKDINYFEGISLEQVRKVLGNEYEIIAVAPIGLVSDYLKKFSDVVYFDPHFFRNTVGYSELLISLDFYERFNKYEYMLIYQLDAFVFSNRLCDFCEEGYSYWGAVVGKRLWWHLDNHVGNGGFSLRKIECFIDVLKDKGKVISQLKESFSDKDYKYIIDNEDQFWAYCAQIGFHGFTAPDIHRASDFSVESNINNIFSTMKENLPFGCHRWYKANFEVWEPIIKEYGYKIPNDEKHKLTHYGTEYIRAIFYETFQEKIPNEMKNNMMLDINQDYSLWGGGLNGKQCYTILKSCGYNIINIFDKNEVINIWNSGIDAKKPVDVELIKKIPIIISSYNYENEMAEKLISLGLRRNIDFFFWTEVETKWLEINGRNVELI